MDALTLLMLTLFVLATGGFIATAWFAYVRDDAERSLVAAAVWLPSAAVLISLGLVTAI